MPQTTLSSFFSKYARVAVPVGTTAVTGCTESPVSKSESQHPSVRQASPLLETSTSNPNNDTYLLHTTQSPNDAFLHNTPRTAHSHAAAPSSETRKRSRSTSASQPPLARSPKEARRSPSLPQCASMSGGAFLPVPTSSLTSLEDTPPISQPATATSQSGFIRSSQSSERGDDLLSDEEAKRYGAADIGGFGANMSFDVSDPSDDDSDSEMTIKPISQILRKGRLSPVEVDETYTSRARRTIHRPDNYYAPLPDIETDGNLGLDDGRNSKKSAQPPSGRRPAHRVSPATLLGQIKQDELARAELIRAFQRIGDAEDVSSNVSAPNLTGIQRDVMASVINAEEGNEEATVSRVMHAVGRTDAAVREPEYCFFTNDGSTPGSLAEDDVDPIFWNTPLAWASGLQEQTSGFLSGFASDWTDAFGLPPSFLKKASKEDNLWLCQAYHNALRTDRKMIAELSYDDFVDSLRRAGATSAALDPCIDIAPAYICRQEPFVLAASRRQRLLQILGAYRSLASIYPPDSQRRCLVLMLRMCTDLSVSQDCQMKMELRDTLIIAIAAVCGTGEGEPYKALEVLSSVASVTFRTIKEPRLQLNLVQTLSGIDHKCSMLRKRLALAWFLEDAQSLDMSEELVMSDYITAVVQKSRHALVKDEDFSEQVSMSIVYSTRLLETALDAITVLPPQLRLLGAGGVESSASMAQHLNEADYKEAVRGYDGRIDRLCLHLKVIQGHLVDNAGANMARTEARAVLDRLVFRLEGVVRIKAKTQRGLMEDYATKIDGREQASRDMLKSWLGETSSSQTNSKV